MEQFLPEQISVLAQVLNDPGILAGAATGVSSVDTRQLLHQALAFVRANHAHFGSRSFVLRLTAGDSNHKRLTHRDVLKATANATPVIQVTPDLFAVGFHTGGTRVCDAEGRTAESSGIEIVVHGTYLYCVGGGRVVFEGDAVLPEKQPPIGIAFYRPIGDFDGLLKDHFYQDVSREKSFKFWENRSKRILLATPEKTEKIFQRALFNWLDRYVTDKLRVVAETREFGQDPTDVLVITVQGDHIVEVKWLGKNEHHTRYDAKRITEGLRQVSQYITNDPQIVQAHLVLYDARAEEENRRDSAYDPACKHAFCSEPKILFLPSETPSQKAKLPKIPQPKAASNAKTTAKKSRKPK